MTYNPTNWSNGVTKLNAPNLNNIEDGITDLDDGVDSLKKITQEAYGLRWNQSTDTYTRLGSAEGKTYTKTAGVITSDFDSIYPWSERKRCNLADDLTVNAYHGDAGYIEDGSNGQVMVENSQFWVKTEVYFNEIGQKIFEWFISEFPRSGYKLHPAFINTNQSQIYTKVYTSAFEGTLYDDSASAYVGDGVAFDYTNDIMASVANLQPISGNTANLDIGEARQLAENRGAGWTQGDYLSWSMTQLLYLIEFADFKSQNVLSFGILNLDSGTGNHSQNTGHTSPLGNASGEVALTSLENGATGATETYPMSYRGEENFYGNIWKFVDGILIEDDGVYIQDDITDFNDTHTNYNHVEFTTSLADGYISDLQTNEGLENSFFPLSSGGSSSTYVGDYYYAYSGAGAIRILRAGGSWYDSSKGGAFADGCDISVAVSSRVIGANLVAKA